MAPFQLAYGVCPHLNISGAMSHGHTVTVTRIGFQGGVCFTANTYARNAHMLVTVTKDDFLTLQTSVPKYSFGSVSFFCQTQ